MRLSLNGLKYKKFYLVFVNNLGYIGPSIHSLDKSLHPFLVGYRDKNCYLDTCISLGGLQDSFKVLSNVVSDQGRVLLVGGNLCFISVLLCLFNLKSSNIVVAPWDFSQIRAKSRLDLILVHELDVVSQLESESKYSPYIVVNGTKIKDVPYPCNISLKNPVMSNWYLYGLINSCRKGLYLRNKIFNEI